MAKLIENGKVVFIRNMAAQILDKRPLDVTAAQLKAARALFLAQAYDAVPSVVQSLTKKVNDA